MATFPGGGGVCVWQDRKRKVSSQSPSWFILFSLPKLWALPGTNESSKGAQYLRAPVTLAACPTRRGRGDRVWSRVASGRLKNPGGAKVQNRSFLAELWNREAFLAPFQSPKVHFWELEGYGQIRYGIHWCKEEGTLAQWTLTKALPVLMWPRVSGVLDSTAYGRRTLRLVLTV